jgi:hypothetical protein
MPNEIDSMRDMIGTMDNINVEVIPLDDEMVEEEAELANAPDEKYADTDVLVNKISGGLNRRKKQYRKEYPGDNPMAVTESEEELTARFLKEYDEFKVTAPEDSDEGDWEIQNVGKWTVKIGKSSDTPEEMALPMELPFDTELAGVLADEAVEEGLVEDDVEEGLRIVKKRPWRKKADTAQGADAIKGDSPEKFSKQLDKPKAPKDDEDELNEDDVEEGLRMEFPDGSCEGSRCPDDRNRRKKDKGDSPEKFSKELDKPKAPKDDALDKEMSEDKK